MAKRSTKKQVSIPTDMSETLFAKIAKSEREEDETGVYTDENSAQRIAWETEQEERLAKAYAKLATFSQENQDSGWNNAGDTWNEIGRPYLGYNSGPGCCEYVECAADSAESMSWG